MTNQKEACSHCSSLFVAYRSTQKYCSKSCNTRAWYARNKDNLKSSDYQYQRYAAKAYGLSLDDIEKMNKDQAYSCKICGVHVSQFTGKKRKLCVDHCHSTGKVRGLLCESCNTLLGMAKDSQQTLSRAIDYLKEYSNE